MELADKLDALAVHCGTRKAEGDAYPWVVVRQSKKVLGIVPYTRNLGTVCVLAVGESWRAMLVAGQVTSRNSVYLGVDFRQPDAVRDGAWKHTKETGWQRIQDHKEEQDIFSKIEELIDLAAMNLPALRP